MICIYIIETGGIACAHVFIFVDNGLVKTNFKTQSRLIENNLLWAAIWLNV